MPLLKTQICRLLYFFTLTASLPAGAQGIYQLWGTTYNGGQNDRGVIFSAHHNGMGLQALYSMMETAGSHPTGTLLLFNDKVYGMTRRGGASNNGVLFEFDPTSKTYSQKVNFDFARGSQPIGGTLAAFDAKLYGLTTYGGAYNKGVLFEWDPLSNQLVKKLDFNGANGAQPQGGLILYNQKFYGLTSTGGATDGGVLFEWDPVSGTYHKLYEFGLSPDGRFPSYNLAVRGDRLYGICTAGGDQGGGVVFEYHLPTGVYKRIHHFDGHLNGTTSYEGLAVLGTKLYGTARGGSYGGGILFEIDIPSNTFVKRFDFSPTTGTQPTGSLVVHNQRLYGLTSYNQAGIYEYNPLTQQVVFPSVFDGANGAEASYSTLLPVPAPVAPGLPGTCQLLGTVLIDATNNSEWVAITDGNGAAVAEIHARGNNLGEVKAELFVNDLSTHPVREDNSATNNLYLDRNITLTSQNVPATPVQIRLYLKASEVNALKNAVNSQGEASTVQSVNDLAVYRNNDPCGAAMQQPALPVAGSLPGSWGLNSHGHVFFAETPALGSFYFAARPAVLPIRLHSFSAQNHQGRSQLEWSVSGGAEIRYFEVECRAASDTFQAVSRVAGIPENKPITYRFTHTPQTAGIYYYRLKLVGTNGHVTYSAIKPVTFSASTKQLMVLSNPVSGAPRVQFIAPQQGAWQFQVYTATGQLASSRTYHLAAGPHGLSLPFKLQRGTYVLAVSNGVTTYKATFLQSTP